MTATRSGNTSAARRRNWIGVRGRKFASRLCRKSALKSIAIGVSWLSDAVAEDGAFVDGALGVEFASKPGAADHMHGLSVGGDVIGDAAVGLLTGADDDGVERQHLVAVG